MAHPDYARIYERLRLAIEEAPTAQLALREATDVAYAFMEEAGEDLSDEEYLGIRMLLSHAEGLLTRYFGM